MEMSFSTKFVIPGEREAKLREREGDPGGDATDGPETSAPDRTRLQNRLAVIAWVPFPNARGSRAFAGDDKMGKA